MPKQQVYKEIFETSGNRGQVEGRLRELFAFLSTIGCQAMELRMDIETENKRSTVTFLKKRRNLP